MNTTRQTLLKKYSRLKNTLIVLVGLTTASVMPTSGAQTLTSNETGTHDGFYYSFWKDTGNASFGLESGGRYTSQWDSSINNWVGGKGWKPGKRRTVSYTGSYNVDNSQNSYLALYGWTTGPLIEYYIIESYGSYNPSNCSGGQDMGSFQSDGATYNIRRCQRVNQPSIEGTATFYQYFSVRTPKKGFGNISGTITVGNHFDAWAAVGLNLGAHDYQILATEGYLSTGSSDITVCEGTSCLDSGNGSGNGSGEIVVRARGANGDEQIKLIVEGNSVAEWTLSTSAQNYTYTGAAVGEVDVEYVNDASGRDVILDYVVVNGETRQAEDMEYNTATYGNGECGGGSYSETMHCSGVIGFGRTDDCFSGDCSGGSREIIVRARGSSGDEHIKLIVGADSVAEWTLSTSPQNYTYTGDAVGEVNVEYDNDASGRDVILDHVVVNGETRQAEDMDYNTATYGNGECGGGSHSETMHCSGVIGFGHTDDCFSGNCSSGGAY